VGLGVIPGFGGTQRLAQRVGVARARELIFSGAIIDAGEALRIGLANAVVDPADLMPRVRKLAAEIAVKAPLAVGAAKRALREGQGYDDSPYGQGLELERRLFSELFSTVDQKEGMRAFVEKRQPTWTGR
jgi:enoyl-CoA hydratase